MTPTILTRDLLEELDRALERIGAPITRLWRPGLTDDEMVALTEPIGIRLPAEARVWWGWHDGVTYDDPQTRLAATLGDGWATPPLQDAVQDALRSRDIRDRIAARRPGESDDDWRDSWIAFVGVEPERLACECETPEADATPVVYYDPEFNLAPSNYHTASMGDVVAVWLEAIEDGTWHIDPDTGNFALMDPVALARAKGEHVAALL